MQDRIFCEYCEKVLSQQKGEYDNGCLDCHGQPYANKIFWLKKENKKLQAENAKLRECVEFYAQPWERGELDGELLVRKSESYDLFTEVHYKAKQCLKELEGK